MLTRCFGGHAAERVVSSMNQLIGKASDELTGVLEEVLSFVFDQGDGILHDGTTFQRVLLETVHTPVFHAAGDTKREGTHADVLAKVSVLGVVGARCVGAGFLDIHQRAVAEVVSAQDHLVGLRVHYTLLQSVGDISTEEAAQPTGHSSELGLNHAERVQRSGLGIDALAHNIYGTYVRAVGTRVLAPTCGRNI